MPPTLLTLLLLRLWLCVVCGSCAAARLGHACPHFGSEGSCQTAADPTGSRRTYGEHGEIGGEEKEDGSAMVGSDEDEEEVVVVFTRENRGGSTQHATRATRRRRRRRRQAEEVEAVFLGGGRGGGCLYSR